MARSSFAVATLMTALALPALAAETPVTVTVKPMTFDVERNPLGATARGSTTPGTGYYPIRDPVTRKPVVVVEPATVDVIVLDNGIVEAWVCPAFGGRLLRAVDKKTGTDYFWRRIRDGKWVFDDFLPWNPGGVKASFPFFEHGLSLRVPAGHRTVTGADGAVTVAMDMRFTNFQSPADIGRYGHYGDEVLTTMVRLRPGSGVVEWIQRKDNNNPTPRSDRMWSDASFPVDLITKQVTVKDKTGAESARTVGDTDAMDKVMEFLYPAKWVVNHGPSAVHTSPHWSAPRNWDVSHFAIDAPYGFAGGWYARENVNRLRINDPRPGHGPGAKLWTSPGAPMFEIWGGEGWVFEYPGELQPAYKPTQFAHRFWVAQGIGRASYANADVAVAVDGKTFKLTASRAGAAVVSDETGAEVASGTIGPHTTLGGSFAGAKLVVKLNGAVVMEQTFPLDRPVPARDTKVDPAAEAMFETLKSGGQPSHPTFHERGCFGRNEGQPGLVDAVGVLPKVKQGDDPIRMASLARVAYRLGMLAESERIARLVGGDDGDFILGLVALEKGESPDFGKAGWQADYLRALVAKKQGDSAKAIKLAKSYVTHVPDAWYPRLAIARWSDDAALAVKLAEENPGSPEAQLVLKALGKPAEIEPLVAGREVARQQLEVFEAQIEKGEYRVVGRYTGVKW